MFLVNPFIYGGAAPPLPPNLLLNFQTGTTLGNFTFSRGSAATYVDSSGHLVQASSGVPRFEYKGAACLGMKKELGASNYCQNFNANPADLTGLTAGGDGAAILSIVTDPSNLLTTAVYDYGNTINLSSLCTGGKLVKLDNTGGGTAAWVEFTGNPPDTAAPYSMSLYAAVSGGAGTLSYGASGLATAAIPVSAVLLRAKLFNVTPDITGRNMRASIPAGAVMYCILNQIEKTPFPTSVIVVAGAQATRSNETLSDTGITSRSYYNAAAGAVMGEFDLDEIALQNSNQHFAILANGTGLTDCMSAYMVSGRSRIKSRTAIASALCPQTLGPNAGNSGVDLSSVDKTRDVFQAGFTWTAGTSLIQGVCNIVCGCLDVDPLLLSGPFASTLNRLDIGGRPSSESICGHIRSIKIWNTQPTIPQLGGQMNFTGAQAVIGTGQSNEAYSWGVGASNSGPENAFNSGEKNFVATLDAAYPSNRNYLMHVAQGGASYISASATNSFYYLAGDQFQILYYRALDMIKGFLAGGGTFLWITDNQGESDITNSQANIIAARNKIWSGYRAAIGNNDLYIVEEMIGRRDISSGNNTGYQCFRETQRYLATYYHNLVIAPERVIQPMGGDSVHMTNAGYAADAYLRSRKGLSATGQSVSGPVDGSVIHSASLASSTISVNLTHPSGITDFTPASAIQGFRFFDQATAPPAGTGPTGTEIAITAAVRTDATTITLSLASVPSTSGLLYYCFGEMFKSVPVDPTMLVRGNDAYALPLRSATMALPYNAAATQETWGDGTNTTWSDGTLTTWSG